MQAKISAQIMRESSSLTNLQQLSSQYIKDNVKLDEIRGEFDRVKSELQTVSTRYNLRSSVQ